MTRHPVVPLLAALAVAAVPVFASTNAWADGTIKQPGEHPDYHVDIEPHGVLSFPYWDWGYYGIGFGGGARFSIPVCKNCFIPRINNNVAISFGIDLVIFPAGDAATNFNFVPSYFYLPVAMQWNFFVHKKWSVGPEVGFAPVVGAFYNWNNCGGNACHNWWINWMANAVARYHFNDRVALTLRVGYPEFANVGVSFWL